MSSVMLKEGSGFSPAATMTRTQFAVHDGVTCGCCAGTRLNFITPQVTETSLLSGDRITPSTHALDERAHLLGLTRAAESALIMHAQLRYGEAALAVFAVLLETLSKMPLAEERLFAREVNREAAVTV